MRALLLLLLSTLAYGQTWVSRPSPRIWLDSAMLAHLKVKFCVDQPGGCVLAPEAQAFLTDANTAKTYPAQMLHISSISNGNPTIVTTVEAINTSYWPANKEQVNAGTGNGTQTTFSATFTPTVPVFAGSVTAFKGAAAAATDDGVGGWTGGASAGSINYTTGAVTVTFISPPSNGTPVNFVGYIARSQSLWMGGLTGAACTGANSWTCLNNPTRFSSTGTQTGLHTFTMPFDSTSWGAYPGGAAVFAYPNDVPGTLYYGFEATQWLSWFQELCLMYQVTGDASYATNVITQMDFINQVTAAGILAPVSIDNAFPFRAAPAAMAIGLDWLYPLLTPTQRTATRATLKTWYDYYESNKTSPDLASPGGSSPIAHSNYFGGYIFGLGLAALATGNDDSNGPTMLAQIQSELTTAMAYEVQDPQFGWYLNGNTPCPQQGGPGPCGGNWAGGDSGIESFTYTPNHITRLLQFIWAVFTGTGQDMVATETWGNKFVTALSKNFEHTLFPNRWQAPNVGQSAVVGPLYLDAPAVLAWMRRGNPESGWMAYLISHSATPPGGLSNWQLTLGATTYVNPDQVLWYDSTLTQTDYTMTEPPYQNSPGDGIVRWRTGWGTSDLMTTFSSSPANAGGHHAQNAGGLTITRGSDYGLINAGYYLGANGYSGGTGCTAEACVFSTWYPTMNFLDGGAYMRTDFSTQANWGYWIQPKVRQSPAFSYAMNDFTEAYDQAVGSQVPANRSVQATTRSHFQFGSNSIVYDRVLSKSATYTGVPHPASNNWWFSPITGAATLSGNVGNSVVGSSKFWVTPLLPASPSVTITQPSSTLAYLMKVQDTASNARTDFLTVIHADASGGSNPTSSVITSSSNMVGVQVDDSAAPLVYLQSNVIMPGAGNTYTFDGQTTATWTTSHAGSYNYFVAGLAPGTYNVTVGGSPVVTGGTVGTDGTLGPFASSSGSFSLSSGMPTTMPGTVINGVFGRGVIIH